MGYTHYWTFKKAPKNIEDGKKKFAKAVTLFKRGLRMMKGIELADGYGKGGPIITDEKVCFNGVAPLDYETCYMTTENKGFDFCKTGHRPYDPAVCLLLLCMANEFGDDFEYSSDGDIESGEEGWAEAKRVFEEIIKE